MNTAGALTLDGLLEDPLTRLVMRSDGVSQEEFSGLLMRVKDHLVARGDGPQQSMQAAAQAAS